jgi:hypothetical protein
MKDTNADKYRDTVFTGLTSVLWIFVSLVCIGIPVQYFQIFEISNQL